LTVFTSVEVALYKLQTKGLNLPNNFYSCSQKSGGKKEIRRKILKGRLLKEMTCRIIDYVLEH